MKCTVYDSDRGREGGEGMDPPTSGSTLATSVGKATAFRVQWLPFALPMCVWVDHPVASMPVCSMRVPSTSHIFQHSTTGRAMLGCHGVRSCMD